MKCHNEVERKVKQLMFTGAGRSLYVRLSIVYTHNRSKLILFNFAIFNRSGILLLLISRPIKDGSQSRACRFQNSKSDSLTCYRLHSATHGHKFCVWASHSRSTCELVKSPHRLGWLYIVVWLNACECRPSLRKGRFNPGRELNTVTPVLQVGVVNS